PPGLAAVAGGVDVLAADIDRVVVVGRDHHGAGPVAAVIQLARRVAGGHLRPDLDVVGDPGPHVVARDDTAYAAEARGAGPDEVGGLRVGWGRAALSSAHTNTPP